MNDIYYAVAHRSQEEIDSFKTRYEDFDEGVITPIFKKDLNLTVKSIRQSESWGSSHVIYYVQTQERDKELVFRANLGKNPSPERVMLVEKLVTDQVAETGVPTNRVLHVDISRKDYPFDYQIQEKILGNDLEDHFSSTKEEYDQMSYELGVMIGQLSELTYDKFGKFDEQAIENGVLQGTKDTFYDYLVTCLESDLDYLRTANILSKDQTDQVIKIFADHQEIVNLEKGSLVHHDLADHNIMFMDNRITALFDWEACVVGDPVLDLASCPTWRTHFPRKERLLAGFQSVRDLPSNFQEKWDLYTLRTMLWKMVYAIRMDIVTDARVEKFKTALEPFSL